MPPQPVASTRSEVASVAPPKASTGPVPVASAARPSSRMRTPRVARVSQTPLPRAELVAGSSSDRTASRDRAASQPSFARMLHDSAPLPPVETPLSAPVPARTRAGSASAEAAPSGSASSEAAPPGSASAAAAPSVPADRVARRERRQWIVIAIATAALVLGAVLALVLR